MHKVKNLKESKQQKIMKIQAFCFVLINTLHWPWKLFKINAIAWQSQGYQHAEFQDFTFNNNILRNADSSVFAKYKMLHLSSSKNDDVKKNIVLIPLI